MRVGNANELFGYFVEKAAYDVIFSNSRVGSAPPCGRTCHWPIVVKAIISNEL